MKSAIIFGITGQDGSYLAEFLLKKGYEIHGVKRRSSINNTERIDHIYQHYPYEKKKRFHMYYGDLLDGVSINQLVKSINPDEIYNLAAQSHVAVSFFSPVYTADVNSLGCLKILEAIRQNNPKIKYYQAGTSEMFGKTKPPQTENSKFDPQSPYAISKVFSHHLTVMYRDAYKIFACNGILFNHESPRRGENFVTKKICKGLCEIKKGLKQKIILGNIYSKRDWGHAKEYVEVMWKILQQKKPDDYVVSTGKNITVKEFINSVCKELKINIKWKGKGINEKCFTKDNKLIIEIDKKYFRPLEVENLKGNSSKLQKKLNWKPKINIKELVRDMVNYELNNIG